MYNYAFISITHRFVQFVKHRLKLAFFFFSMMSQFLILNDILLSSLRLLYKSIASFCITGGSVSVLSFAKLSLFDMYFSSAYSSPV